MFDTRMSRAGLQDAIALSGQAAATAMTSMHVSRRDRLSGLVHEYAQVA